MSAQYVRTHLHNIEHMQIAVTQRLREVPETLNAFGEADLFTGWATHLQACGADEAAVIQQVSDVVCVFLVQAPSRC